MQSQKRMEDPISCSFIKETHCTASYAFAPLLSPLPLAPMNFLCHWAIWLPQGSCEPFKSRWLLTKLMCGDSTQCRFYRTVTIQIVTSPDKESVLFGRELIKTSIIIPFRNVWIPHFPWRLRSQAGNRNKCTDCYYVPDTLKNEQTCSPMSSQLYELP